MPLWSSINTYPLLQRCHVYSQVLCDSQVLSEPSYRISSDSEDEEPASEPSQPVTQSNQANSRPGDWLYKFMLS